eukprot:gene3297-3780_t
MGLLLCFAIANHQLDSNADMENKTEKEMIFLTPTIPEIWLCIPDYLIHPAAIIGNLIMWKKWVVKRAHFKTDWHIYNVKQQVLCKEIVDEASFYDKG